MRIPAPMLFRVWSWGPMHNFTEAVSQRRFGPQGGDMSKLVSGLRRFGSATRVICIVLALSSATAHAQTFKITNLTNNTAAKASFPNLVIDGKGNSYLAWVDPARRGIVVASQFDGTKFNAQAVIPTAALPAFQPQIAVRVVSGPTPNVEIVWASLNPASTPTAPLYDVFAARSNDGGATFPSGASPVSGSPGGSGPVALADTPRVAFDTTGTVDVVWGQTGVWISQATDGQAFGLSITLLPVTTPPTPPPNTGGPRIAVSAAGHIFVAWTDEAAKNQSTSFCMNDDPNATMGGNFWMNETLASNVPSFLNTRNLSAKDWNLGANSPNSKFQVGFYGCSFDNLILFNDTVGGRVHLLWSDDSPDEDVLTSKTQGTYPAGSPFAGLTQFSFPINLANLPAGSPQIAIDNNGSYYVVWSGGPTGGTGASPGSTNSQGIFFSRSDDHGETFSGCGPAQCPAINIAAPNAVAPAYPHAAVDSSGNVSVAWEQVDQQKLSTSDTFGVFFAHSSDRGNTFPTVVQVSTNSSALCFNNNPAETTPDNTTCGTVQLGLDTSSSPDMAWVNQAGGAAVADIDLATTNLQGQLASDFNITATVSSQTAQSVNFSVNATGSGGFSGSIALACSNFSLAPKSGPLSCSFTPATINAGGSSTGSITLPPDMPTGQVTFNVNGTSGGTTHRVTVTMGSLATVSPTSANLSAANASANFTITVSQSGFPGPITFSCVNGDTGKALPSWLTCSFNPQPLNPSQSNTDTLTVSRVG
ncbi:MAG TPA: hypothetical protein VJP04_15930, partial [Terriglobales bacterium]|nr:hypothetical protein [Terriglobales bacterium]